MIAHQLLILCVHVIAQMFLSTTRQAWRMSWFFLGSRSKSTVPVSASGVGRLNERCSGTKKGAVLAAPCIVLLSLA